MPRAPSQSARPFSQSTVSSWSRPSKYWRDADDALLYGYVADQYGVASFVSMLIVALGGAEATATQVTGLIMAGATVIGYVIGEGLADASNASGEDSGAAGE